MDFRNLWHSYIMRKRAKAPRNITCSISYNRDTERMTREKILTTRLEAISDILRSTRETIAVAESVTSGLLQYALSTVRDAAQFFQGGITTYNIGQKTKHLDIEPIQAACCDCVSYDVAKQMSLGVAHLFKSTWGIGITGYATPVVQSDNKVFCYYAITKENAIMHSEKITTDIYSGEKAQCYFIGQVITALHDLLKQ